MKFLNWFLVVLIAAVFSLTVCSEVYAGSFNTPWRHPTPPTEVIPPNPDTLPTPNDKDNNKDGEKDNKGEIDPIFNESPAKGLTKDDIDKIRSPKVLVEVDPKFSIHPANRISEGDVDTLQNLGTETACDLPILASPPLVAKAGDRFVHSTSLATCQLFVTMVNGREYSRQWMTASDYSHVFPNGFYSDAKIAPCKPANSTGEAATIVFPNYEAERGIFETFPSSEFTFVYNDSDYQPIGAWPVITVFVVKLSDDVDAVDSDFDRTTFQSFVPNAYPLAISFSPAGAYTTKTFFEDYRQYYNGGSREYIFLNGVHGMMGSTVIKKSALLPGIYGIFLSNVDTDHNITYSDIAPVKLRIR